MKRRAKKRKQLNPSMPAVRSPFDVGGFPLKAISRPPGATPRGGGRLGKLKARVAKTPAKPDPQIMAAKALARWDNEGGRPAPRAKDSSMKPGKASTKRSAAKKRR